MLRHVSISIDIRPENGRYFTFESHVLFLQREAVRSLWLGSTVGTSGVALAEDALLVVAVAVVMTVVVFARTALIAGLRSNRVVVLVV